MGCNAQYIILFTRFWLVQCIDSLDTQPRGRLDNWSRAYQIEFKSCKLDEMGHQTYTSTIRLPHLYNVSSGVCASKVRHFWITLHRWTFCLNPHHSRLRTRSITLIDLATGNAFDLHARSKTIACAQPQSTLRPHPPQQLAKVSQQCAVVVLSTRFPAQPSQMRARSAAPDLRHANYPCSRFVSRLIFASLSARLCVYVCTGRARLIDFLKCARALEPGARVRARWLRQSTARHFGGDKKRVLTTVRLCARGAICWFMWMFARARAALACDGKSAATRLWKVMAVDKSKCISTRKLSVAQTYNQRWLIGSDLVQTYTQIHQQTATKRVQTNMRGVGQYNPVQWARTCALARFFYFQSIKSCRGAEAKVERDAANNE